MAQQLQDLKDKGGAGNQQAPFPVLLERSIAQIERALPAHLKPERMARIALTAFRRSPKLAQCDPRSVLAAVIQSAQLGLEPDTLGRAYLVPYKQECQFIPGWKGLVELMSRAGQASAWTGAVFEGDSFDYQLGDQPFVRHKPTGEFDGKKLRYVYAVGRIKGSEWPVIEVWPMARVWKHRDRFNKVGERHYSHEHPEMYARKVVLLQVLKYMPLSPDVVRAIELDKAAEAGRQGLNIDDAIDGTWTPVAETGGDDGASTADGSNRPAGSAKQDGAGGGAAAQSREQKGGAAPSQMAETQTTATKPLSEMTAPEIIEQINRAETMIRVEELVDLARSLNFTPAEKTEILEAAEQKKNQKQQQRPARGRQAVE